MFYCSRCAQIHTAMADGKHMKPCECKCHFTKDGELENAQRFALIGEIISDMRRNQKGGKNDRKFQDSQEF